MLEKMLKNDILEVVHPNMAELSKNDKEQFAMLRRNGLGASDASVYLGVNIWNTVDSLIEEKLSVGLTDKEIEVGNKENVRKGSDLEPLILRKFSEWSNLEVEKPKPMYALKEQPHLRINFDGVVDMAGTLIPVEAKFSSIWANKYWDRSKTIQTFMEGSAKICGGANVQEHIQMEAELYGIPPYYYTQIQQQMLGLNAPFGYFATLFDKGWELGVYKIFKDAFVQEELITQSKLVWDKVEERRKE